jgi:hypothetical protein
VTRVHKSIAAGVLIALYVFGLTWRGFGAWFTVDDLTNIQFLHGAGQRPFLNLLAHCLVVATPEYRPLGGVVYRILYAVFGLSPLPFRIACYALLFLNLFLAALFFYRLSHSRATAALGKLVFSVHTCMGALYFNTGTLYDILCFTFGFAALILYVTVRENGALLRRRHWVAFFVLFGLALDSKEMAVTWPLLILLYEFVFQRGGDGWPVRLKPIALAGTLALLYSFVKTQVPNEMSITPPYIPRISAAYAWEQLSHYYRLLVWDRDMGALALAACLALLLLLGIALRNRQMIFSFVFANVALLPLLVIPGRAGFVWYIPFAGWALYFGSLLSCLVGWIARQSPQWADPVAGVCFLSVLAILFLGQRDAARHMGDSLLPQENYLKSLHDAVLRQKLDLTAGSRILIADDPLGPIDWSQLFLLRLMYHDATLWVDRPAQMGGAFDPKDVSVYSAIVHAAATPIRVLPGQPIACESTLATTAAPASVNRNNQVALKIGSFRECGLDVEYRLPGDELARSGLWKHWCTVGADGVCTARIDQDAERGIVQIERVRLCGGDWRRTNASFEILP